MVPFLIRRIAGALLVTLFISFVAFALLDVVPGDAADVLIGESASQEQLQELRHELGLDRPLFVRYSAYLKDLVLHGDLGDSVIYQRPVAEMLGERFKYTLLLALTAMGLSLFGGLLLGSFAALKRGGWLDFTLMSMTSLGLSLPVFWVALLLIMVFSLRLGWLPVVGAGTLSHLILPTVCLALPTIAIIARLARGSLLDASNSDYVRTAYAKGLNKRGVWGRHILRNSLIPLLTLMGLHLGHLLGGTFIIETIFAWPGLGRLIVEAVFDRDFPLILGAVLFMAVVYQIMNLLVDAAHAVLDPRVGRETL